jgi:hypothetical protein
MSALIEGPSGGAGGRPFDDVEKFLGGPAALSTASILSLQVNAGDTLDHLQVTYQQGVSTIDVQHGTSPGGVAFDAFLLDLSQGEKLIRIDGALHFFNDTLELRGLQFTANSGRISGVFGAFTGERFKYEAPSNGEIFALWGREGLFIDALGVFVRVP